MERDSKRAEKARGESLIPEGTVYSVMIPWVEVWVMDEMITSVMSELCWGEILGVDFVYREGNGKRGHYRCLCTTRVWKVLRRVVGRKCDKGNDAKVWWREYFWKVRKSNYVHRKVEKTKFEVKCEF